MAVRLKNKKKLYAAAAAVVLLLCACLYALSPDSVTDTDGKYEYHFIDVGQGDSTLILSPEAAVVIDTGPASSSALTVEYISQHTDKIDVLILTHPHEDHIGGAERLLTEIGAETVIMPDAASDTVTFKKVLDALEESGAQVRQGKAGDTYRAGDISLELLAPASDSYEETNNYSIVTRVVTGSTSVLVTGDAESASENEILSRFSSPDLNADVLKIAHHGSSTSTTTEFLSSVSPEYAVISCGKYNSYGHPSPKLLERLEKAGTKVYRTDTDGFVVFYSDGKHVRAA